MIFLKIRMTTLGSCFDWLQLYNQINFSKMKRKNWNLARPTYEDQSINPRDLFDFSAQFPITKKTSQEQEKNFSNLSSTSNKLQFSERILSPNYRTLTQQSLTQESMNDQNGRSIKPIASSSNKLPGQSLTRFNAFKCTLSKRKKQKNPELKHIIHRHKISNMVRNFIWKLRRNNPYSKVVEMQCLKQQESEWQLMNATGIDINQSFHRFFEIILLAVNFLCIYYYTLSLAFDLTQFQWSGVFEVITLIVFLVDFGLSAFTTKSISGKKMVRIKDILFHYFKESLLIDLMMIIMLIIDISNETSILNYLKLVIILKIPYLLEKMEKIEIHFISTTYKEQYWSLVKLFLFNFCFAHILALLLKTMGGANSSQNWMITKNIDTAPWHEIYIWSYYWAINIMLTVGFGDIVATNYVQALCLIFIETFSCMALAYNINCVGSLISNIRAQDLQKSKKYKIFRSLAQKHHITNDLFLKISNYIEQSNNIKKKFNIEEQNKFIDNLPKIFKKDYLKQANKSIFQRIYFFSNLADKAIQSLAQSIEITITHPEQLIINIENYMGLKILKEGQMGYCCRKLGSVYNGHVIDYISVQKGGAPILLGLEFITHRRPSYEIKSLEYSIIYGLTYERLIQSLRKSRGDYEYLCFLRDKSKHVVDEFQISHCKNCNTKHTRFLCPKLHFVPIKQQCINRALYNQKNSKSQRVDMDRMCFKRYSPLKNFHSINQLPKNEFSSSTINRNKAFLINQLKNIERFNSQISHEKTIYDYPMVFLSNAAESIKQELANFLRRENEEDQVWTVALDYMQNYKNYFPDDNPGELQHRFSGIYQLKRSLRSNANSPFIVYKSQKERVLKEGTYIEHVQHALDSQTYNEHSVNFQTFQQS